MHNFKICVIIKKRKTLSGFMTLQMTPAVMGASMPTNPLNNPSRPYHLPRNETGTSSAVIAADVTAPSM